MTREILAEFEAQERKNREKYGERGHDHIAQVYSRNIEAGDTWTLENAIKYIRRFQSKSGKAKNKMDLMKAVDYICRAIEANQLAGNFNSEEVIDR